MISPSQRDLTSAARRHARQFHDDGDHTVSAALLTRSGRVITAINAFHFLGGPCGEVAALAQHASTCPEDPVACVVAVHGPSDQVIPPCGKCRQILFDTDPEIDVLLRGPNGFEAWPVRDLLPHAFTPSDLSTPQRMYMWEGYEAAIRTGRKTQTIRIDDPFHPGPAVVVFEKESGEVVEMDADVVEVATLSRDELTDEHARRDGFGGLEELNAALDEHYPGLPGDAPVDVVRFETASQAGRREFDAEPER